MRRLIGSFGYEVHIAGNVTDALAAADARLFDVIISDIGLPDGSGFELMRQLRSRRPTKGIRGLPATGWKKT